MKLVSQTRSPRPARTLADLITSDARKRGSFSLPSSGNRDYERLGSRPLLTPAGYQFLTTAYVLFLLAVGLAGWSLVAWWLL